MKIKKKEWVEHEKQYILSEQISVAYKTQTFQTLSGGNYETDILHSS